jgi:hypothetical protein
MQRQRSKLIAMSVLGAALILLIAGLTVFAGGGRFGGGPPGRPSASATPSAQPTGTPRPSPSGEPSPPAEPAPNGPTDDAGDGVDAVPLANWPGVDSSIVVWDETDTLADAVSGSPDREPVGRDVVEVLSSADGSTVRLTWSDIPIDSRAMLTVRQDAGGVYHLRLVRPQPAGPTDNVGSERVLELHFNVAVPVEDVEVTLVDDLLPTKSIGLVQAGLTSSGGTGLVLAVWDETEGLSGASIDRVEGEPSVGPDTVLVENVDDDTLRLTFADPEAATYARISVRRGDDGRYQLRLVRERPQGATAPVALERVVLLDFLVSVPADDVDVEAIDTVADEA